MAYCSECGSELKDGAKFCGACGAPVRAVGPVEAFEPERVLGRTPERGRASAHVQTSASVPTQERTGAAPVRQDVDAGVVQQVVHASTRVIKAPGVSGEFAAGAWAEEPDAAGSERAPQAKGKRRRVLPAVAGVLAVAALAAVLALYVVPLFAWHPHDPHEDEVYVPTAEQVEEVETGSVAGQEPTSESATEQEPEQGSETKAESTAESELKVEPKSELDSVSGSKSDAASEDDSAAESKSKSTQKSKLKYKQESTSESTTESESTSETTNEPEPEPTSDPRSYDTADTPVVGEFTWFSNDMMNGIAPEGIKRIADVAAVTGGWKAYIYNYAIAGNEYSQPSEELLNVYIDAGKGGTTLTFDWYYTRGGDGQTYKNAQPSTEYAGAWKGGAVEALGMGSVRLSDFWEQDGHQYAIGRIGWPDGVDAAIGLVRP